MEASIQRELGTIHSAIQTLLGDSHFNSQQLLFINHMDKTASNLLKMLDSLPATESTMMQVLPVLGDNFLQAIVALYGYSRLLLEHPASFDGATIPENLRPALETIYASGISLSRHAEVLIEKSTAYRLQARQQAPYPLNLIELIQENLPVYRYWIREKAVQVTVNFEQEKLIVLANAYHLNELIKHIIVTVATELIEYGLISLSAQASDKIDLVITCTGIQLDDEAMHSLFQKEGRKIYLKQIQRMKGTIHTSIERGRSSSIIVSLPIMNAV